MYRILAIETSSKFASIAACEFDGVKSGSLQQDSTDNWTDSGSIGGSYPRLLSEKQVILDSRFRTTTSLFPSIQALMKTMDWLPSTLDQIVTTTGPGSFTGLRIGVTSAKSLAYALRTSVCGINTLQLMAASMSKNIFQTGESPQPSRIAAILDAQRNECFIQHFDFFETKNRSSFESEVSNYASLRPIDAVRIVDKARLQKEIFGNSLLCYSEPKLFVDTQLKALSQELLMVKTTLCPIVLAELGVLGKTLMGSRVFELKAEYYRKSAAEEKLKFLTD